MRTRLLQATVDCLVERGYAGTTTTAVVARAGVSRGAVLHHFPTKAELVATAVEFVLERRSREFKERFAQLPRDERFVDGVVNAMVDEIKGPTFYAWMELLVAARTEPALKTRVAAVADRWAETLDATYRAIFDIPRTADHHPFAISPIVTFMIMEGLALERIARTSDPTLEMRVIRALKTMAPLAAMRPGPKAPSGSR